MADKQISQLIAAETVHDDDLLVLQQGQVAKKLTGKKLGDYVYAAAAEKIAEVNEAVAETQEAVDELEEQKNAIAQTIADMAELGTDTTLTTPGMAADAKATGDRIGEVEVEALASLNQKTISNVAIASFNDGADNAPVKELIIDIEPVQSGSGDPSPTNVRPITGWTEANIYKSNVNLCGGDVMLAQIINNGNDASRKSSDDDGDYYSLYAASSANGKIYMSGFFKPNTRYTFMFSLKGGQNSQTNIRVLYTDGTSSQFSAPSSTDKQLITMVTSSGKTVSGLIGWYHNNINAKLYYNDSGVFEGSVLADDFVKATGSAYQADWETEAGTVYGAKLNATKGKLLVDTGVDDLSLLTWTERYAGSVNKVISASLSSAAVVLQGTNIRYIDGIAEQYTNRGQKSAISDFSDPDSLDVGFYCIAGSSTTNTSTLYLVIPVADSATGKIIYKLYNSTTEYDLDPVVIKTLYGTNNIWADTGNINSLIYYSMAVDNNYVIEKMRQLEEMISGVEPTGVASTNYASGSLIISRDVLVRLIANVVSGETISTGTGGNATETTIEAELQAIKNSIPIVAGDISYDDTETYPEYTVGSELKRLSLEDDSQSEKIEAAEADISENLGGESLNLYDISKDTAGKVIGSTGAITDNSTYRISDFIYIGAGNKFTFDTKFPTESNRVGVTNVCYYDSTKTFKSRYSINATDSTKTITMASGRDYIRFNIKIDTPDFMCNMGESLQPYSPYGFHYSEKLDDFIDSKLGTIPTDVADLTVKFPKYVGAYSDNLYDYTQDTKGKVINSSGELVDNNSYKISDFIYIGEGNTFTFNTMYPSSSNRIGVNNIVYYNASKTFVTRANVDTSNSSQTITMASGRDYVRFNILIDTPDFMVNLGSSLDDYKPHFDYSAVLSAFIQTLIDAKEIGFDKTKRINFTRDISDRYSFTGTTPTHNFDATSVTTAQMYALYDAVMEDNSDYITMEEIGTASDNQKLRAYTLKSDLPVSANNRRRIKCLITCGTHGWEKSSTETMLMFMQEVCGRWKENAFYESFMRDVELIIIPVVNPYGFDNGIRKNANGVDLNRNFPVDWGRFPTTETDVDYAGTEALSEPESQAIYAYLQTLTDKLDFAFDFHEFGKADGRATWVETIKGTTRMGQLAQLYEGIVFDLITTKYSVLENADFGTLVDCSDSYGNGRLSATLAQFADYSCTYEVAGEMPLDPTSTSSQTIQRFTNDHVKLCLDLFINFFCVMLRESAENSKQIFM